MLKLTTATPTRRFERVPAHHLVTYATATDGGSIDPQVSIGRTRDISQGGVCLETGRRLGPGDLLLLEIALRDRIVPAMATVIYVRPSGADLFAVGVQFESLPEAARRALSRTH